MSRQVLIYEDNSRLSESLKLLISSEENFDVLAVFNHCDDAVEQVSIYNPDLIIMDINMPGIGGIEGVRMIKSQFPEVKILMYTVFDNDDKIYDAICAGADGYLLKNTVPTQLISALEDLMQGGAPMSPFVAQRVFQHFRENNIQTEDFHLSNREKEILSMLVAGNSYKMIAAGKDITIDTVKKHLQNIYHKLHVSCGTEAVAKALQYKIIKL